MSVNIDMINALKAVRKANRENEIALYGKTINHSSVVPLKTKYTRKVKHKKGYSTE